MAESRAAKIAKDWSSRKQRHETDDLKGSGLPEKVQAAILAVEDASWDIHERVELAEQIHESNPDHPLALEPGKHLQTTWAQQFEFVGGEVLEITKESATSPVTIKVRDDLHGGEDVDPVSALEARLQTPLSEDEKGSSQEAAEKLAQKQVRDD